MILNFNGTYSYAVKVPNDKVNEYVGKIYDDILSGKIKINLDGLDCEYLDDDDYFDIEMK